jgi:putative flavoprotein involved in K+ transport
VEATRALHFVTSPTAFDLRAGGIHTVLWATGYRRDYSWLKVPVVDAAGEIRHDGGITPSPGLYVLGLNFLRRRRSHFIDGVGFDAMELAGDIHCYLAHLYRAVA